MWLDESMQKISEVVHENRRRRQFESSSTPPQEAASGFAGLQREIMQLKHLFQQLQEEVRDFKVNGSPWSVQLSALSKDVATLKQNQTPVGELQVSSLPRDEQLSTLAKEVADLKQNQMPRQVSSSSLEEQLSALAREVTDLKHQRASEDKGPYGSSSESGLDHNLAGQLGSMSQPADLDHHLGRTQLQKIDEMGEIWENLTMDKLDENSVGYEIQESIWDSCALFGFDCIRAGGTLWIFMGTVATIAMELLLVLVVFANYRTNPYTDDMLEGLLHWRAVVAHDIGNSDPISGASLAALTCAQASGIATSTSQMTEAANIAAFREPEMKELSNLNGLVLCNLALFLWLAIVFEDIVSNIRFSCAVLSHPRGRSSIKTFGEQIRIASFSVPQVFLIFLLSVLPRMGIDIFLGTAGIFFLGYTSSVGDLLLNAVALTFILDVDELFFIVFVPRPVKLLMRTVEPLSYASSDPGSVKRMSAMERCFHEYINQVLRLSAIGIALYFCNTLLIYPFNDRLDKAYEYICGGRQDFLYHKGDTANYVRYAVSPSAEADFSTIYQMDFQKLSVLELIGLNPKYYLQPETVNSSIRSDYEALGAFDAGGIQYEMGNLLCIDYTNLTQLNHMYPSGAPTEQYAKSAKLILALGLETDEEVQCSQLNITFCSLYKLAEIRALCPRACGCDNPWMGQFYATGYSGCPYACNIRWQMNADLLPPKSISDFTDKCEDVPADILSLDFGWSMYALGLQSYLNVFGDISEFFEEMMQGGCEAAFNLRLYVDICEPNADYRSLRLWCPAACGCTMSDMRECPRSCSAFMKYQILDRCPFQLEIESAAECERAASHVLYGLNVPARIDNSTKPGCFLQETQGPPELFWSSESANTSSSRRVTLCRQAGSLIWDAAARGRVTVQQSWARSFLVDEDLQEAPALFQD